MCINFPWNRSKIAGGGTSTNISVSPCLKGDLHLQKKAKKTRTELFKVWY